MFNWSQCGFTKFWNKPVELKKTKQKWQDVVCKDGLNDWMKVCQNN